MSCAWPFSCNYSEAKNINTILPNEVLVRIFTLVDHTSDGKAKMRASLAVRLTCRKWNDLVKKSRFRRPIGLMRIAQVDSSYGIFMIDSTDDEFITELMENANHPKYWLREKSQIDYKKLKPILRSIVFNSIKYNEAGVLRYKTEKLWNKEEWNRLRRRTYEHTNAAKSTTEFLHQFNALLQRYDPQNILMDNIQLSHSLLQSITAILEGHPRIPRLYLEWDCVNIASDVTTEDVQRLFANSIDLTGLPRRYCTQEFCEKILATSPERRIKLNGEAYSFANFEKVANFGGYLKTSLAELCEAIEKRTKLSNEIEWHLFIECNSYYANESIGNTCQRFFEKVELDPETIGNNKHHFLCNGVHILIELKSKGYDDSARICVRSVPPLPILKSRWDKVKERLSGIISFSQQ